MLASLPKLREHISSTEKWTITPVSVPSAAHGAGLQPSADFETKLERALRGGLDAIAGPAPGAPPQMHADCHCGVPT
jgi:hypothetical protein